MSMVYLIAMKSKDPSTHVAAVVVGPDHEPLSWGFNGLPRGMKDDVPERNQRPLKYHYYEHGERNACFASARTGVRLQGGTMYTNGVPCSDCARAVIQAGIIEVVVDPEWETYASPEHKAKWQDSCALSQKMLEEAGVKVRFFNGERVKTIQRYMGGKEF